MIKNNFLYLVILICSMLISCIKDSTSPQTAFTVISNGGFEELSGEEPINWELNSFGNPENSIVIENNDAFEGNNSLKFHHAEENGCWEIWISQDLDRSFLVEGATYRLTLNYKADFEGNKSYNLFLRNTTINLRFNPPIEFYDDGEWYELSYEFGIPVDIGNNDIKMNIHFCIEGVKSWWIDNIKMEKVG